MKSYHDQELTDLVQRIESQAALEALDKVLSQLHKKADMIENLLHSEIAWYIYMQSAGENYHR